MEVKVIKNSSFPMNTISEKTILVNIRNNLYSKNMNILCELLGEDKIERISEGFEQNTDLFQTLEFRNYKFFKSTDDQTVYSGYLNFDLFKGEYEIFMEYCMISMFNQIRNKAFVSFSKFEDIWRSAQITSKDLSEHSDKVKLILVSGIPGSGKTTLGIYLSKLLNIENIHSSTYIMPVKDSIQFIAEDFLNGLFSYVENSSSPTVVAVIPSYHHLKKVIFEFKKNTKFNEIFDLEHVITRVSAKNFYMHKNRNTYQFTLENCLKGI